MIPSLWASSIVTLWALCDMLTLVDSRSWPIATPGFEYSLLVGRVLWLGVVSMSAGAFDPDITEAAVCHRMGNPVGASL